jgi:hypothetical protein
LSNEKNLISSLFFVSSTKAQMSGQEDSYLASYKKNLPYFQELITGGQYVEAPKTIEGYPFYFSRQFMPGILSMNDIRISWRLCTGGIV